MTGADAVRLAVEERLYPATIVHGGSKADRIATAEQVARALVCTAASAERPCGSCHHCRRVALASDADSFHPDVRVLSRDLKTSTSVDATRQFVALAYQSPFEARGQVFVIEEAESLTAEAANALLKVLEEPPAGSPRHYLLLAPARDDLLPTLRSRSWAFYLGPVAAIDQEAVEALADGIDRLMQGREQRPSTLWTFALAELIESSADWRDPRAHGPWATAAAACTLVARRTARGDRRRQLLDLAGCLLEAPAFRLRSIRVDRTLEGLIAGCLVGDRGVCQSLVARL